MTLISIRLNQSKNDQHLYIMADNTGIIYVLVYVDDVILASNSNSLLKHCESALKTAYEIENLGEIKNYLGMHIRRDSDQNCYVISQTAYHESQKNYSYSNAKIGYSTEHRIEIANYHCYSATRNIEE